MNKATQPINQMTDDELWAWWLSLDDEWRWLFLRKGLNLDFWQLVNQNDKTAYLCEQFNKQYHYQQHFDWFNKDLAFQYVKQIQELTELNLSYSYISDILVLSNLTQINWLYLRYNNISDISPLANLIELTELDLSYNKISDISLLENLTELIWLNLYSNKISNISALKNLIELEHISLSYNKISDISVLMNLTQLKRLDIEYNPINPTDINWLRKQLPNCQIDF